MQTAAIWGAGFIAQTHVDALRANGINIALVVSRTRQGAQEFAAAHGIPTIGVAWGYGAVEDMQKAGAAAIADTPEQLLELLK